MLCTFIHWCALSRSHTHLYYSCDSLGLVQVRDYTVAKLGFPSLVVRFVFTYSASGAMHSGDMAELGGVNLTDAEREALMEVMQRAKVHVAV